LNTNYKTASVGMLVGFFLLAPAWAGSAPREPKSALHIKLGLDSNVCGITVPPLKPKRKIGLIVWLHGGMRSGNSEKGAEAHRAILPFIDPTSFYLASPSAFGGQDWLSPKGIEHIDALIEYMVNRYPIDLTNINLVGVSDGSLGVIAYTIGGKFPLRRHVLISSFPQIVIPPEALAGQTRFTTGTWDFFQGGQDRLFPTQQVLPYLNRWVAVYPNAHLHYFPEGEHDFSYYATHAAEMLKTIFASGKTKAQ
jgi:hypothetical protein